MADLRARVDALEGLVLTMGHAEFGDSEGHPFRGNQYTGGQGGSGGQDATGAITSKSGSSGLPVEREQELRDTYGVTKLKDGRYTTEIDVTGDTMAGTSSEDGAKAMAEAHSLTYDVIRSRDNEWPVYAFDGSEDAILRMLNNYDSGEFP